MALTVTLTMLLTAAIYGQRRRGNPNGTIASKYNPAELFFPNFYAEKGNGFHSASNVPGPKY